MTLKEIFNDTYLTHRATKAVVDSLRELEKAEERKDFASDALTSFEVNGGPIEILDYLYLSSQ